MNEHIAQFSNAERNRHALTILRYILESEERRAKAALYHSPLGGSVLGHRRSVLQMPQEAVALDVNTAIQAIGGIPAEIEQGPRTFRVDLLQWQGPDPESPGVHKWLGNMGIITADIHDLHQDLEAMLQDG